MSKQGRRTAQAAAARRWVTPAIVAVALLGGGVVAMYAITGGDPAAPSSDCTPTGEHEHASYAVYVHNVSVRWNYPPFDFAGGRGRGDLAGHLHLPADHTIHMEGGKTSCTTVERFFLRALGTRVSSDALVLDTIVHEGRSYRNGEDGTLRFFLKPADGQWREAPDLPTHQPYDGEYLLVTYGKEGPGAIAWQQSRLAPPDPRENPGHT